MRHPFLFFSTVTSLFLKDENASSWYPPLRFLPSIQNNRGEWDLDCHADCIKHPSIIYHRLSYAGLPRVRHCARGRVRPGQFITGLTYTPTGNLNLTRMSLDCGKSQNTQRKPLWIENRTKATQLTTATLYHLLYIRPSKIIAIIKTLSSHNNYKCVCVYNYLVPEIMLRSKHVKVKGLCLHCLR